MLLSIPVLARDLKDQLWRHLVQFALSIRHVIPIPLEPVNILRWARVVPGLQGSLSFSLVFTPSPLGSLYLFRAIQFHRITLLAALLDE